MAPYIFVLSHIIVNNYSEGRVQMSTGSCNDDGKAFSLFSSARELMIVSLKVKRKKCDFRFVGVT